MLWMNTSTAAARRQLKPPKENTHLKTAITLTLAALLTLTACKTPSAQAAAPEEGWFRITDQTASAQAAVPPPAPVAAPKAAADVPLILTALEQRDQQILQLRAMTIELNKRLADLQLKLAETELGISVDQYEHGTLAAHPGAPYEISRKNLMWGKLPEPASVKSAVPKTNPTPAATAGGKP